MYDFIEPIVLSGTDGVITCFNLMIGLGAADFDKQMILIIVIIAIIGDSISMAISYFNSKLMETSQILDWNLIIHSLYNIIAFVFFGTLSLIIYLYITEKPSIMNAYISIIIPLLLLGIVQMRYRNGNVSFIVTVILGMLGSVVAYAAGTLVKMVNESE